MTQFLNQDVDINAYYFRGKDLEAFPQRIEYDGRAVTFAEGFRYLIQRGGRLTYLFDMSDDSGATYRLRQENNQWTLVGTW